MRSFSLILLVVFLVHAVPAMAWHDRTHLAIGQAAGYKQYYNLAAPDIVKVKASDTEDKNHYYNGSESEVVTPELVRAQVASYNAKSGGNADLGHLYGALVGAVKAYQESKKAGKYAEYHLAYVGHYCGDLLAPLHNITYPGFNKENHSKFDGLVEDEVLDNTGKIPVVVYSIKSEDELIELVSRLGEQSRKMGYAYSGGATPTKEDAYQYLGQAAGLFKAILEYVGK